VCEGNILNNLRLFEDDVPSDNSAYQGRLDGQFLLIVALREGITIARRRSTSYSETFAIANMLAPTILGREHMLFQPEESESARVYREKARLLSKQKENELLATKKKGETLTPEEKEASIITAINAVDKDIDDLKSLLKADSHENPLLQRQLDSLYKVRKEFVEQEIAPRDEHDIILKDWNKGIELPTFFAQDAHNFHDFALPDNRVMRIRILHPQKAETITGVDLLYENHQLKEKMARIAAVQYKVPQGNSKNIVIDDKIQGQLNRLRTIFCGNELCVGPSYDNTPVNSRPYCLPCCCAFFRPTDRLQGFNPRLATSGYHIRVCDVDRICGYTKTQKKLLTPDISREHGISSIVFEELFNTNKLGSRWLTYEQLDRFHRQYEIVKPYEQAGIYIQEAFVSGK
jgi:hypothetical protein